MNEAYLWIPVFLLLSAFLFKLIDYEDTVTTNDCGEEILGSARFGGSIIYLLHRRGDEDNTICMLSICPIRSES